MMNLSKCKSENDHTKKFSLKSDYKYKRLKLVQFTSYNRTCYYPPLNTICTHLLRYNSPFNKTFTVYCNLISVSNKSVSKKLNNCLLFRHFKSSIYFRTTWQKTHFICWNNLQFPIHRAEKTIWSSNSLSGIIKSPEPHCN